MSVALSSAKSFHNSTGALPTCMLCAFLHLMQDKFSGPEGTDGLAKPYFAQGAGSELPQEKIIVWGRLY